MIVGVMDANWRVFMCAYVCLCVCVFVRMSIDPIASLVAEPGY